MIQREVVDKEKVHWVCVQSYSMAQGKTGEKVKNLPEEGNGQVTVVCTPDGGEKSVRIELQNDWNERMEDKDIIEVIEKTK